MIIITDKELSAQGKLRVLADLAAILPGVRFLPARGGFSARVPSPGGAADALPLIENLPGVLTASLSALELYPRASAPGKKLFSKPLDFTAGGPVFIAGPCAVEDEASYLASAAALKAAGAQALRAAIFKPRSSPYAFQGIGWAGLKIIAKAKKITGLPLVTEATDTRQVARLAQVCDVIQIGARNMRSYELLKEAGASGRAVLLKRGMGATLREWLLSAEYLLKHGAGKLMLCERGDSALSAAGPGPDLFKMREAKRITGLPVLADPSHPAKDRARAAVLALKALRAGADGLLVEASASPQTAKIDGRQTLAVETFRGIVRQCSKK